MKKEFEILQNQLQNRQFTPLFPTIRSSVTVQLSKPIGESKPGKSLVFHPFPLQSNLQVDLTTNFPLPPIKAYPASHRFLSSDHHHGTAGRGTCQTFFFEVFTFGSMAFMTIYDELQFARLIISSSADFLLVTARRHVCQTIVFLDN